MKRAYYMMVFIVGLVASLIGGELHAALFDPIYNQLITETAARSFRVERPDDALSIQAAAQFRRILNEHKRLSELFRVTAPTVSHASAERLPELCSSDALLTAMIHRLKVSDPRVQERTTLEGRLLTAFQAFLSEYDVLKRRETPSYRPPTTDRLRIETDEAYHKRRHKYIAARFSHLKGVTEFQKELALSVAMTFLEPKAFYALARNLDRNAHSTEIQERIWRIISLVNKYYLMGWYTSDRKPLTQIFLTEDPTTWERHIHAIIVQKSLESGMKSSTQILEELATLNPSQPEHLEQVKREYTAFQTSYFGKSTLTPMSDPICIWSEAQVLNWVRTRNRRAGITSTAEVMAVICRTVSLTYGYEPRAPQLLSVLSILNSSERGRVLQIATGEGKTLTTAMIAAAKALEGRTVDIMSSSAVLAARDVAAVKNFLDKLELGVGVISDGDADKTYYAAPIVYGTIGQFQGDFLRKVYMGLPGRGDRPFDTVLVDEVDSSLIDEMSHITMLSGHKTGMEFLEPLLTALWRKLSEVNQQMVYLASRGYWVVVDSPYSLIDGEIYLHDRTLSSEGHVHRVDHPMEFKKQLLVTYLEELVSSSAITIPTHLLPFVKDHREDWIAAALRAEQYVENVDYVCGIEEGKQYIMPVDRYNTGMIQKHLHWSDGVHQFLQLKHGLSMTAEGLTSCFVSNIGFIQKYGANIFGLSGTLGDAATLRLFQTVYALDSLLIPTYRPKAFRELPGQIKDTTERWQNEIIRSVREKTAAGRGCLVMCESIEAARTLQGRLREFYPPGKLKLHTRSDDSDEMAVVGMTLEAGDVIIATNLAGRGTDIHVSDAVLRAGGMHVCVTSLPKNSRVEAQNFGRTARKGQPGSAELVLYKNHLIHQLNIAISTRTPISEVRQLRDEQEAQRLYAIEHITVPEVLLKDKLFDEICKFRERLKAIDMDESKLKEVDDLWALEYHGIVKQETRTSAKQKAELQEKLDTYGLSATSMVDDVDSFYYAVSESLHGAYSPLQLKKMAFQYLLSTKAAWTDAELKELARTYHDSRKWTHHQREIICALSKALNRSIIVVGSTMGVEFFAKQTGGEQRIIVGHQLSLFHPNAGNQAYPYYSVSRREAGDYSAFESGLSTSYPYSFTAHHLGAVTEAMIQNVLQQCAVNTIDTLQAEAAAAEHEAMGQFRAFARDIEERYRCGNTLIHTPGTLCLQALKHSSGRTSVALRDIDILTQAIEADPVYSYGAYYNRGIAILRAKQSGYKAKAVADFTKAIECAETIKAQWEAMLVIAGADPRSELAKQLQAKIRFLNGFIERMQVHIRQIRACKSSNEIVVKDFESVREAASVGGLSKRDIAELATSGVYGMYTLEERAPSTDWLSVIALGVLSVMQVVTGTLMSLGTFGTFGTTLIAEGIKDLWAAIKLAYNGGAFDWEGYFTDKGISTAMLILQVGGGALLDKVCGTAAASTSTAAGTIAGEAATEVARELTWDSAMATIKPIAIQTITQIGIHEGSMFAARKVVEQFSDTMHDRLQTTVGTKLKTASVKEQLEALWIVDYFEEDEVHQQWVMGQVDAILGGKSSRMMEMISRVGGVLSHLTQERGMISSGVAGVVTAVSEGARYASELAEIVSLTEEVLEELMVRIRDHVAGLPTFSEMIEMVSRATADMCTVPSTECDQIVARLTERGMIRNARPWVKGGIRGDRATIVDAVATQIALVESLEKGSARYQGYMVSAKMLNHLQRFHEDGHKADTFIDAVMEHVVDKVHSGLSHRISSTAGRAMGQVANAGIDLAVTHMSAEVARTQHERDEAQLRSLREHGVLAQLPARKPLQPWEVDETSPPIRLPGDTVLRPSARGMRGTPAVASAIPPARSGAGDVDVERLNAAMTHPRSAPLTAAELATLDRGLDHLHPEALLPIRAGYGFVLRAGRWVYEQLSETVSLEPSSWMSPKPNLTAKQRELLEGKRLEGQNPGNVIPSKGSKPLKVDTELPGGEPAARSLYERLTGDKAPAIIPPEGLPKMLQNGQRITIRTTSTSGYSKIEINDSIKNILEKITFK